jgi:hypothetical protein
MLPKRYSVKFKTILFFFLLVCCSQLHAQDDEVTDSVSIDTTQQVIESIKEEATGEKAGEEKEHNYFLQKDVYVSTTDSLHLRKLPAPIVKKMLDDDDYWYANAEFKKKKVKKEENESYVPLGQQSWFQTLLWLLIIGGFAGFITWYLAGSNVSLFRKKAKPIDNEDQDEVETENIFAINYQKEIDKAARQENYRLAVRLMFLRLLKNLSEKNIIQYNQGKTNLDYLLQLHPTRYYKDFFRITRNYEYSWYGQFEVNEQAYHIIRNDFDNFDRQLKF